MAQAKTAAKWMLIAMPSVASLEGVRQYVYRDPVGIPTYCLDDTQKSEWGRRYSMAECKGLLASRLQEFNDGVNRCVHVPMSDSRRAAVVSFSYNVGTGNFCHSTLRPPPQRRRPRRLR
jgi:lysozyme